MIRLAAALVNQDYTETEPPTLNSLGWPDDLIYAAAEDKELLLDFVASGASCFQDFVADLICEPARMWADDFVVENQDLFTEYLRVVVSRSESATAYVWIDKFKTAWETWRKKWSAPTPLLWDADLLRFEEDLFWQWSNYAEVYLNNELEAHWASFRFKYGIWTEDRDTGQKIFGGFIQ